jgi:RNA polymerase sigma factor (sigma-70 family)
MSAPNFTAAFRRLAPDDAPDGELLARYVSTQDEAAFDLLVRRHGGMVRAVCRRVLRNDADADDAVQATFLVLVRKAAAIREKSGLANWLFGVAHNVALKARQTRTRRQAKEAGVPPRPPEAVASDFAELLHAELAKLPAASRGVIVLCDLEGRTIAAAAKHLGIPAGTVASRLARGRDLLARRLRKYGLSVSSGLLATLFDEAASAAVAFDPATASPFIHSLANEVTRTMFTTPKVTKLLAAMAAGGLTLATIAWGQAPPKVDLPPAPKAPPVEPKKPDPSNGFAPFFTLSQAIVKWDGDDKLSVRVEVPVGRSLRLTDANGKPAFVHELSHQPCGPVMMPVADVELYDLAGNKKAKADWKKVLKDGGQVLYVVEGLHDLKLLRQQFATFLKDDVLVLVVPRTVHDQFDPFKNLLPIASLPQVFPGQPAKPGDPVPPPKK